MIKERIVNLLKKHSLSDKLLFEFFSDANEIKSLEEIGATGYRFDVVDGADCFVVEIEVDSDYVVASGGIKKALAKVILLCYNKVGLPTTIKKHRRISQ